MGRRFFKHGELPLVLLALVAEKPMSAYDLMVELGRLFGPFYRPSPGSVYPAVEALEAEGLLRASALGTRTTYEVTSTGRDALERRRDALGGFELRTGARVTARGSTEALLARFSAEVQSLAPFLEPAEVEDSLEQAAAAIRERIRDSKRVVADKQQGGS